MEEIKEHQEPGALFLLSEINNRQGGVYSIAWLYSLK